MQLYACIHISDGKAVNPNDLYYTRNSRVTLDPVQLALHWQEMGATYLHLIDLDASAMGYPVNDVTIKKIADAVDIPVQYGGGIRTIKDIDMYFNMGVSRVIVGTQAVQNPHFLREIMQTFDKDRILAGIDVNQGIVTDGGRGRVGNYNSLTLAQQLEREGIRSIVYTDVGCEMSVKGPDIENTKEIIRRTHLDVIYAGGIASLQDLKNMQDIGTCGVLIGAALYTDKIKLQEAVRLYERGERFGR
ncbi:HisA/HisF-related TIM barrel protein [Frisingicoccus sp.]|uniref:1-(5-phosphoribosyl)-5-[(5- phosphoribosylamino)methylideneamino]imidazole-4- carboxamide isomerase n=1 Tax=Frisingicoccus sp. TaxID=1918627 RepID=UPI002EB1EBAF|nr:1-(5-phosphoribosyl)-5-[(5-phosphoribosylamino)methylideneamino] imidazole-4-carboxamide isomerase [Frisingicoccus sp.]